jgi:hypothetical protein
MSRLMLVVCCLTLAVVLPACGPFQTYGQGMDIICHGHITCEGATSTDPNMSKRGAIVTCIEGQLWNSSALAVWESIKFAGFEEKGTLIQAAATEAGIADCPFAEVIKTY